MKDNSAESSHKRPRPFKVEFWQEGGLWWFHAPSVVGGGCRTMRAAFRHCAEAIEDLQDYPPKKKAAR